MGKRKKDSNLPRGEGITLNPNYLKDSFQEAPPACLYNAIGYILAAIVIFGCIFLVTVGVECAGGACRDLTPTATAIYIWP